jgi:hypothetical protein
MGAWKLLIVMVDTWTGRGTVVIDEGLFRSWDFSEGLAAAMRKGEKIWGYIDTSGEFAISPRFDSSQNDYVFPFSDGVARILVRGSYGYIDRTGAAVIPPKFLQGFDFREGMASVVTDGPCAFVPDGPCGFYNLTIVGGPAASSAAMCKFGFIDKTGRILIGARFDAAKDFSEGLAPVKVGGLWGFVNRTGQFAIEPRFQDAEPFSSGLARIKENDLYGYVDQLGSVKITPALRYAESFSDGFAVVGDGAEDERFWYIDASGNRVFDREFRAACTFFHGLANVEFVLNGIKGIKRSYAYIDTTGRPIFRY